MITTQRTVESQEPQGSFFVKSGFYLAVTIIVSLHCAAPSPGDQVLRAVWAYDFGELNWDNTGHIGRLSSIGITDVFLSIRAERVDTASPEYVPAYTNTLVDYIKAAHKSAIKVHAMTLEDPHFAFTETLHGGKVASTLQVAKGRIQNILNYNQTHSDAAFDGIHLDIEPHALAAEPRVRIQQSGGPYECDFAAYLSHGHHLWTIPGSFKAVVYKRPHLGEEYIDLCAPWPILDTDDDGDLLEEVVFSGPTEVTIAKIEQDLATQLPRITVRLDPDIPPASMSFLEFSWLPETEEANWERCEGIIVEFLEVLDGIRSTIDANKLGIALSAAIPWWFNEEASAELPSAGATKLSSYLDLLVPMVYFEDQIPASVQGKEAVVDQIWNRAQDEVAVAPTIVALNVDEFKAYDFSGFTAVLEEVTDRFVGQSDYLGTAVFDFAKLEAKWGVDDDDSDGVPNALDPEPLDDAVCGDQDGDGKDDCSGVP